MKKAIVSIIVGNQYQQFWKQYCERSWRAYAERHAYDIVIIDKPILPVATKSIHWHKLLVLEMEAVKSYDRVVWLDSDILINVANAPSIVEQTPEGKIGVVLYGDLQDRLKQIVWERWAQAFSELGNPLTALKQFWPEYYKRAGLEGDANIRFNTGVLVLTPSIHGEILGGVFHKYSNNAFDYEQTYLNFELTRSDHYQIIDSRFNIQVGDEVLKHYPFLFFLDPEAPVLLSNKLFASVAKLCLLTLHDNSYFLHFCGARWHAPVLADALRWSGDRNFRALSRGVFAIHRQRL